MDGSDPSGLLSPDAVRQLVLDKIASGEAQDYNELYGGGTFKGYDAHPNVRVDLGNGEYTTAAGRYQFITPTWQGEAARLGLKDFSPASQDAAAWDLAQRTYSQNTNGRSLVADVQSGTPDWSALGTQWASLAPRQGHTLVPVEHDPFWASRGQALSAYQPSWRDQLAAWLSGGLRDVARQDVVLGVLGSRGLGPTGPGLVDFTPLAPVLAGDEAMRAGASGNMLGAGLAALGVVPAVGGEAEAAAKGLALTPVEHNPFAGLEAQMAPGIEKALSGAAPGAALSSMDDLLAQLESKGMTAAPVEHDPFGEVGEKQADSGPELIHVGEPMQVQHMGSMGHQVDYKTANGGSAEFLYYPDGTPSHAVLWSPSGDHVGEVGPESVVFPPLPKAKTNLYSVGSLGATSKDLATFELPDGGTVDYHYVNGDPTIAFKYDTQGNLLSKYSPKDVEFPNARELPGVIPKADPLEVAKNKVNAFIEGNPRFTSWNDFSDWGKASIIADAGGITPEEFQAIDQHFKTYGLGPGVSSIFSSGAPASAPAKYRPPSDFDLPESWAAFYESLAPHETKTIKNYTSSDYRDINEHLAGLRDGSPMISEQISNLDSALAKAKLPEPMILYRGIDPEVEAQFSDLQPGDLWVHGPFASTSTSKQFAADWKPRLIEIHAPPGAPAAAIAPISNHPNENEVLLPRGAVLRLQERTPAKSVFEYVPTPPPPAPGEVNWIRPDANAVAQEYNVEYLKHFVPSYGDRLDVGTSAPDYFARQVANAPIINLSRKDDAEILGRSHTGNMDELLNLIKGYQSYPEFRNEGTLKALEDRMISGGETHLPIIVQHRDGTRSVLSGNTRLDIAFQHGDKAKALLLKARY